MKKIISAAALAAMVAGTAFADVSWSANARVYDDVVTYAAPTRAGKLTDKNAKGTDDNGKLTWNKDTKHADDVAIKASGENCGAQITFDVVGAADGANSAAVTVGTYKLWATILPNLTLNAGTYDTRLGKNINNDGNWGTNLNSIVKPGVYDAILFDNFTNTTGNKKVAKDSTNITVIGDGNRKFNNFMAQYKVNDNLTAYAVVWTHTTGFTQATWTYDNNSARFSPFGVGAKYSVNKDTAIAVTVKNEANVEGSVTGIRFEQVSLNATNIGTAKAGLKRGYVYQDAATIAVSGGYQIWSAAVDVSTKVAGWDAEAAYTFAAGINDKVDTAYGHSLNYWYKTANLANNDRASLNEYIHAFDLRAKGKVGDKLSITALGNVTVKPATAHTVHVTPEFGEVKLTTAGTNPTIVNGTLNQTNYIAQVLSYKTYENEDAYNAGKGLSGKLAHYESLSVDYAFNSQITFEVQVHHRNTNVYATGSDDKTVKVNGTYQTRYDILTNSGLYTPAAGTSNEALAVIRASINGTKVKVNPLANSTFYVRPAVKYAISKQAQLDAGVQFQLGGLSSLERTASTDVTALTVSVPVTFRVKL